MRPFLLAVSLVAALVVAGCDISQSSVAFPPAPTPGPAEQPTRVIDVAGSNGQPLMPLKVYDRSFAVTNIRSATAEELRGLEALAVNSVGAYGNDGRELLLTWAARECAETGNLFVGPGVNEIVVSPTVNADCGPTSDVRGVVIEFKLAVDMKAIRFDLLPSTA